MTHEPIDDPPIHAIPEPMAGIPRAGKGSEQAALHASAWEMLEPYFVIEGVPGTRLANAWLGEHRWCLQIVHNFDLSLEDELPAALAAAAVERGATVLFGGNISSDRATRSAVWRLMPTTDVIGRFFNAHRHGFHILFPPDRSFAIHANDGDFAVYAGPEGFLRAALPPGFIGPAATARVVRDVEDAHGEGSMDAILAHYAPFLLEG